MKMEEKEYDASSIQVLEGLEAVRKRPGMYIGSTGPRGLHHLVWEIVDNSIDEALAGYADKIEVEILPDNIIRVTDNGRGMPVDLHPKTGRPAVETIFTVLHAGGKFDGSSYKVSGGLHGVGASVVNALSEWLEVNVHRNNKEYSQRYERGKVVTDLIEHGESNHTGSQVTFKADSQIFTDTTVYDFETLRARIQQLAFLNKGIKISITDSRDSENIRKEEYHYDGGIKEYVAYLNANKKLITEGIVYAEDTVKDKITGYEIEVEVAVQYNEDYNTTLYSFTNNIHTHEGGTHEEGFRMALTRCIKKYADTNNLLKKDEEISNEDVREGLTAIVSVKHPNPQFEGQTKTKLGNTEVRAIVSQVFGDALDRFLNENPNQARAIIDKCLLASRARIAARKAKEATRRKSPLDS
ncbi:MAG: DNA topoisomerase IV subunit B, partial [Acholeplasmatales bacterium]|nr:DNA topoisomerase IV subunit B [Acholeplasmatales bacterium]